MSGPICSRNIGGEHRRPGDQGLSDRKSKALGERGREQGAAMIEQSFVIGPREFRDLDHVAAQGLIFEC